MELGGLVSTGGLVLSAAGVPAVLEETGVGDWLQASRSKASVAEARTIGLNMVYVLE